MSADPEPRVTVSWSPERWSEMHPLLTDLATREERYNEVLDDARGTLATYGIEIPAELAEAPVTLPPREQIQALLESLEPSGAEVRWFSWCWIIGLVLAAGAPKTAEPEA